MRRPKSNHSAKCKAQATLDAIRTEAKIAEITARHEVHPTQTWKMDTGTEVIIHLHPELGADYVHKLGR